MENQNKKDLINTPSQNNPVVRVDVGVLFSGDSYGLFVFKKIDGLVKAIYLLTGLMSDKEPMRERTRILANKMLENALGMSDRIWGEEIYQKNLLSAVSEVSILFDIAENTKMMSKMNHQIITSELEKLADFLVTSSTNYSSAKIAFEPNLFDGNYNYVPDQTFQAVSSVQNKNTTKENAVKDIIYHDKGHNEKMSFTTKSINQNKTIKDKTNRQDIILTMLKSGVKLTIKDFARNIKDCSEKTIQRELSSLVSKGILKKEGERRWSKYYLVK